MSVRVITVDNVSRQTVPITFGAGDPLSYAGDVPVQFTGQMQLQPGKKVTVEANRINQGQLDNLKNLGLVKLTDGLL